MADRSVRVRISAVTSEFDRALAGSAAKAKAFSASLNEAEGRMDGIVQTSLALGPSLLPIAAVGVPAVAAFATQLGAAAAAGGVALLAFNGVGDALSALNKAQLEPTAENLEAARQAMAELGPAGRSFVLFLDDLEPRLEALQSVAQAGLLPGVADGITELLQLMPRVKSIVGEIATATGDLFVEAGDNLNDPRWRAFFRFLDAEARPALLNLGRTTGNVIEGVANLLMAFNPLADDFSAVMLNMSRSFRDWTAGLSQTQGFQEFVSYIRENGPRVAEALVAVGNAFLQIVEAAAPVGSATLPIIEALANVIGAVADSPAGPALIAAAAGLGAVSRAVALYNAANGSALLTMLGGIGGKGTAAGVGARAAAAGLGVLALSMTDLDDKFGLANTAMFAMMGAMAGPWGAAIGAAAGVTMDAAQANNDLADALDAAESAMSRQPVSLQATSQALEQARTALERLRDDVTSSSIGEQISNWFDPGAYKNTIEGLFGESDVEEAEGRLSRLTAEFDRMKDHSRIDFSPSTDGLEQFTGATDGARAKIRAAQAATDDLAAAFERLNAILTGRADLRDFEAAIDAATAALRQNGRSLDISTAKGRENQASLDGIASTALRVAENLDRADRRDFLQGARRALIDAAGKFNLTDKQARNLADRLLGLDKIDPTVKVSERGADATRKKAIDVGEALHGIPDSTVPRISEQGAEPTRRKAIDVGAALHAIPDSVLSRLAANDQASGTINSVRGNLNSLDGDTATTTITTIHRQVTQWIHSGSPPSGPPRLNAEGDLYDAHQPMIARGGPVRVWAEPETGGESYIPHADDHRRPRAIDIWERTGEILGVQFRRLAEGGIFGHQSAGVYSFQTGGGFVGGRPVPITAPWLDARISMVEPLPSLAAYNKALRERAAAIRAVQREQRQLAAARRQGGRVEARAERELEAALDRRRAAQEKVTEAVEDYAGKQREAVEAARRSAETLAARGDIFGGPFATVASAQAQVERAIKDVSEYGQVIAALKAAGAAPFILAQIQAQAEQGDIRAAIRLGKAFLAQPEALKRISERARHLEDVGRQVGAITADPRFMNPGKWNPQAYAPRVVQVNLGVDPNDWMAEMKRHVTFVVRQELGRGAT